MKCRIWCTWPTEEAPVREALETHCVGCPACQDTLLVLGQAAEPEAGGSSPGRGWSYAAAALLLAAILATWTRDGKLSAPEASPAHGLAEAPADGPLGGREPCARALGGGEVLLEGHSKAFVSDGGTRVRLEAGALWMAGDSIRLECGGMTVALAQGALAARMSQAPLTSRSWLLKEAWADAGPSGQICVLAGGARVRGEGVDLVLSAGRKLVLGPQGWRQAMGPGRPSPRLGQGLASAPSKRDLEARRPLRTFRLGALIRSYRWVTASRGAPHHRAGVIFRRRPGTPGCPDLALASAPQES